MKKFIYITLLLAMGLSACIFNRNRSNPAENINPFPSSNSMNSVDWSGTYRSIDPNGDIDRVRTEIRLNADLTFQMATRKPGKSENIRHFEGTFAWDDRGGRITMNFSDPSIAPLSYKVGEHILFKLDSDGNVMEGRDGNKYNLTKSTVDEIADKYWRLTELFEKQVYNAPDQFREAHLILHKKENRINGNSGCNNFFGSYELPEPNRIRFSQVASTKMACPDMQPEYLFFKALGLTNSYTLIGDTLVFHDSVTNPIAKFRFVFLNPINAY